MTGLLASVLDRARRDLACQELVELVSDYLDGTVSRRTRRRIARHLAACDGCTRYVEQMRLTRELTGRLVLDGPDGPDGLGGLDESVVQDLLTAFRAGRRPS